MNSIDDRLTELESALDDQQARIEAHEETIAAQQETIDAQRERLAAVENGGGSTLPMSRRSALAAGGALGLLGLGAGTASAATPSGQVGTENQPLNELHTRSIKFEKPTDSTEFTNISSDGDGEWLDFTLGVYQNEGTALTLGRPEPVSGREQARFEMNVGAGAFELLTTQSDPDTPDLNPGEGILYISDDDPGAKLMFAFNDELDGDQLVESVELTSTHNF